MIARVILVAGVSLDRVIGYTEPPSLFHSCQKMSKDLEYNESESELQRNDMATETSP